jgi:hypothetical protein
MGGKLGIMFYTGEALFLSRCDDNAVSHQAGSRVMLISRDAEDIHDSEQRIDKGSDYRALCRDQETSNQHQDQDDWRQPELFSGPQEAQKFFNKVHGYLNTGF